MILGNENWRERNAPFAGEMKLAKSLRVSTRRIAALSADQCLSVCENIAADCSSIDVVDLSTRRLDDSANFAQLSTTSCADQCLRRRSDLHVRIPEVQSRRTIGLATEENLSRDCKTLHWMKARRTPIWRHWTRDHPCAAGTRSAHCITSPAMAMNSSKPVLGMMIVLRRPCASSVIRIKRPRSFSLNSM